MDAFTWARWELDGTVTVGGALAFLAYLSVGAWARRRGAGAVRAARVASFASGLLTILLVLNGPLHELAERYLFSAHMVQHLALTLVAPPLLLAGLPPSLFDSTPSLTRWWARLTAPLNAFLLYNVILVLWHVPRLYEWAMEHHAIHIVQHLLFLGSALLLWWPVAGPRLGEKAMAPPAQLLYLFLAGIPMILIAALVTLADEPLYRFYTRAPRLFGLSPQEDQVAGGVIMWVPGSLIYLIAMTVVYFRWVSKDSEEGAPRGAVSTRRGARPPSDPPPRACAGKAGARTGEPGSVELFDRRVLREGIVAGLNSDGGTPNRPIQLGRQAAEGGRPSPQSLRRQSRRSNGSA